MRSDALLAVPRRQVFTARGSHSDMSYKLITCCLGFEISNEYNQTLCYPSNTQIIRMCPRHPHRSGYQLAAYRAQLCHPNLVCQPSHYVTSVVFPALQLSRTPVKTHPKSSPNLEPFPNHGNHISNHLQIENPFQTIENS